MTTEPSHRRGIRAPVSSRLIDNRRLPARQTQRADLEERPANQLTGEDADLTADAYLRADVARPAGVEEAGVALPPCRRLRADGAAGAVEVHERRLSHLASLAEPPGEILRNAWNKLLNGTRREVVQSWVNCPKYFDGFRLYCD